MRCTEERSRGGRSPVQQDRRVGRTEPSPVEASSHEGLKVDGAGERCKGASRQEKERGGDDGRGGGTGVVSQMETQVRDSRAVTR